MEEKHVVNMLKQFYQDNDEVTSMVHEAFIVGSTLYTMAIQFLVANAVFHDPQQYARMVPMTALGAKQFKENPSVKVASSGDLSHSDDITPAVSQRRKRSREVQEVTNEESELTQTKKQKKNKKKKGKC